jgi:hypothetical protein
MGSPIRRSRGILHKAKGDHLDRVHSDQKVLEMIRHGGWSLLSEAKSLKTRSRDYQDCVHSDQMVLVMARLKSGPCERRPNSRSVFLWLRQRIL